MITEPVHMSGASSLFSLFTLLASSLQTNMRGFLRGWSSKFKFQGSQFVRNMGGGPPPAHYAKNLRYLHWLMGGAMVGSIGTVKGTPVGIMYIIWLSKGAQWSDDKKKKAQLMNLHKSLAWVVAALLPLRFGYRWVLEKKETAKKTRYPGRIQKGRDWVKRGFPIMRDQDVSWSLCLWCSYDLNGFYRFATKMPAPLPVSKVEHYAGNVSHYALYALMTGLPISGFIMGYQSKWGKES